MTCQITLVYTCQIWSIFNYWGIEILSCDSSRSQKLAGGDTVRNVISKWTVGRKLHEENLFSRWFFSWHTSIGDPASIFLENMRIREWSSGAIIPSLMNQGLCQVTRWKGKGMEKRTYCLYFLSENIVWRRFHHGMGRHYYLEEVLQYVFSTYVSNNFVLMHDNAWCVSQFLEEMKIFTLNWPQFHQTCEKCSDMLCWRVFHTLAEIRAALLEEWKTIQQNDIKALIASMPNRMQDVISSNGSNSCSSLFRIMFKWFWV